MANIYCERGLARLNWQEYRAERLALLRAGWTETSFECGVSRFVRRGERRSLVIMRRVGG